MSESTTIGTVLRTTGKSKNVEDYNILEEYLNKFKEYPSVTSINYTDIDYFNVDKIRDGLKIFPDSKIIFKSSNYSIKYKKLISRREVWYINNGYMLDLNIDKASMFFTDPKFDIGLDDDIEISDINTLITPANGSKYRNDDIFNKIVKIMEDSYIDEMDEKASIGMVAIDDAGLYVRRFNLDNKINLKHMDLHYGDGFKKFDEKLISRLKKDKKGLILLHGDPGTGKTYYIRHLLKKINRTEKEILYFPPSMVGTITDPGFVNFINNWVSSNERDCIILIEDADSLLESRENDIGNNGITNLLNLTDGILNDIFGIQIIATFNTHINKLDKALLRTERLIARKEFIPLDKERALLLSNKIGLKDSDKEKIKDNMTLSDIYSIKKNNEILTHDIKIKDKPIGFK